MSVLEGVRLGEIEHELAQLRRSASPGSLPDLRMSTMTHIAWVPPPWYEQATSTLRGMGDRHPSRTILLVPEPNDAESRVDAQLALEHFPLDSGGRRVCAEVIVLRLKGDPAHVPASVVRPLLTSDLPVYLRWRGEPMWATPSFEDLVDLVDRLVVNSAEWDDLPYAYSKLGQLFGRTAVSDLAWARTVGWRHSLASLWPGIGDALRLSVEGPLACALLLHGWLRARLGRELTLEHVPGGDDVESVSVDGDTVPVPRERSTESELLADELDVDARDLLYEEAAMAASSAP